jgi:hypothetical protein
LPFYQQLSVACKTFGKYTSAYFVAGLPEDAIPSA